MRSISSIAFFLIASTANAAASCAQEGGNFYCEQADEITYTNFGSSGTYQKITSMSGGKCSSTPTHFSGGLLNEEISWHFRGPLRLKQFAFYTTKIASRHRRRHDHLGRHLRGRSIDEIQSHDIPDSEDPAPMIGHEALASRANDATTPPSSGSGSWNRQAYYNAAQKSASGLVFLNNKGGQGSGVWDATWGNSLSYASSNAQSGSASSQVLADTLLGDNTEIAIFTSKPCTETSSSSSSCGTVRPGTVAYHGFSGPSKLFLLEFSMPLSGKKGFNADMPSAWILNAQIPRTLQYGAKECSCWASGCGEWDIFEVLNSGNSKCKSTFHGLPNKSGGDSNWFARPTGKTIKVAVWFDGVGKKGIISVLPDNAEFGLGIDQVNLQGWISGVSAARRKTFQLPG